MDSLGCIMVLYVFTLPHGKVEEMDLVTRLNWTLEFEWSGVRCGSKIGHHKDIFKRD